MVQKAHFAGKTSFLVRAVPSWNRLYMIESKLHMRTRRKSKNLALFSLYRLSST